MGLNGADIPDRDLPLGASPMDHLPADLGDCLGAPARLSREGATMSEEGLRQLRDEVAQIAAAEADEPPAAVHTTITTDT